jgi:DNA-binding GntR family transcriptional regulator
VVITPQPGGSVYEQLARLLREEITTGRLQPGAALPSESTLQQQYGLARGTVRRAIDRLRQEGLVVARHGHGVYVRDINELQELTPAPGSSVSARMPTASERVELNITEGVPVFFVEAPDGTVAVYPADRWRVRLPGA